MSLNIFSIYTSLTFRYEYLLDLFTCMNCFTGFDAHLDNKSVNRSVDFLGVTSLVIYLNKNIVIFNNIACKRLQSQ